MPVLPTAPARRLPRVPPRSPRSRAETAVPPAAPPEPPCCLPLASSRYHGVLRSLAWGRCAALDCAMGQQSLLQRAPAL
eukprot:9101127-Alexandrium_andersonii.AAC.1